MNGNFPEHDRQKDGLVDNLLRSKVADYIAGKLIKGGWVDPVLLLDDGSRFNKDGLRLGQEPTHSDMPPSEHIELE